MELSCSWNEGNVYANTVRVWNTWCAPESVECYNKQGNVMRGENEWVSDLTHQPPDRLQLPLWAHQPSCSHCRGPWHSQRQSSPAHFAASWSAHTGGNKYHILRARRHSMCTVQPLGWVLLDTCIWIDVAVSSILRVSYRSSPCCSWRPWDSALPDVAPSSAVHPCPGKWQNCILWE